MNAIVQGSPVAQASQGTLRGAFERLSRWLATEAAVGQAAPLMTENVQDIVRDAGRARAEWLMRKRAV